mmetsp:Transcript_11698/g.24719  ORF Transcript_11698/g.24719 Transcript_11698/m.24719 type:complete len:80 (-) Transcript_11698:403-642(-)
MEWKDQTKKHSNKFFGESNGRQWFLSTYQVEFHCICTVKSTFVLRSIEQTVLVDITLTPAATNHLIFSSTVQIQLTFGK